MSILPDHQLEILCRAGLVTPFDLEMINPASLDVRLGNEIMVEQEEVSQLQKMSIEECTRESPFYLYPGEFILAHTIETFKVPGNLTGQFALKSSLARAGFEHLMAGYVDPGFWDSVLTLELKNARKMAPIRLWPGMRIGQVIFTRMQAPPIKTYRETGRYNHDHTVTGSKDWG